MQNLRPKENQYILNDAQIKQICENPNIEKAFYESTIKDTLGEGENPFIAVKVIRHEVHQVPENQMPTFRITDFFGNYLMSITEGEQLQQSYSKHEIRKPPLRAGNSYYAYKIRSDGVAPAHVPQFAPQDKVGYSPKNSMTLINPQQNLTPILFGANKRDVLVGVMFFSKNIDNDPNLLPSTVLLTDVNTFRRNFRSESRKKAEENYQFLKFDKISNPRGILFDTPRQLLDYRQSKLNVKSKEEANETLMRTKWTKNDRRCQLGIFHDGVSGNNIQSKLLAQFRAIDLKLIFDTRFVPIAIYNYDSGELDFYKLSEQIHDSTNALFNTEIVLLPTWKAISQVINIFNGRLKINNISVEDKYNIFVLLFATNTTSIASVKKLSEKIFIEAELESFMLTLYDMQFYDPSEILKHAAQQGHEKIISTILNNPEFQLSAENINDALILAIKKNNHKAAILLLNQKNINVNYCDVRGDTALSLVINNEEYFYLAKQILETQPIRRMLDGGDVHEVSLPLLIDKAMKAENLALLQYIFTKFGDNIDVETLMQCKSKQRKTALHYAVQLEDFKIVRLLLNVGTNVNIQDDNGKTALHYAFNSGNLELIQFLLDKGATIDLQDEKAKTALHYAARYGNLEMVKFLLQKGANVDSRNYKKQTPLHYAASYGNLEMVKLLVKDNTNINIQDKLQSTPLHAAVISGQEKIVEFLLNKDADVNHMNKEGMTPWHHAILSENFNIMNLLQNKKDILVKDGEERNCLQMAITTGNINVIKFVLFEYENILKDVNNYDVNTPKTLLQFTIESDKDNVLDFFLKIRANVNLRDVQGLTCLHTAVSLNKINALKRIFLTDEIKIDFDIRGGADNKTAFDIAITNKNIDVIILFLQKYTSLKKEIDAAIFESLVKLENDKIIECLLNSPNLFDENLKKGLLLNYVVDNKEKPIIKNLLNSSQGVFVDASFCNLVKTKLLSQRYNAKFVFPVTMGPDPFVFPVKIGPDPSEPKGWEDPFSNVIFSNSSSPPRLGNLVRVEAIKRKAQSRGNN